METAADLQAACAALLPGYAAARREPERWAVLTRACLQRHANAYKRHNTHERLARQARSWGVELSA